MTEEFIKNNKVYGKEGELWLEKIPENIAKYEEKWALKVFPPFKLTYNYVAPAERADGTKVVIKMGFPKERENQSEIEALEVFNGVGIEKLLEEDRENGVILIERIFPGVTATELDDDEATRKIASVIKKLHKPEPKKHTLITISEWANDLFKVREWFHGTTGPFPEHMIDKAQKLFRELIGSQSTPMLVHGDLHHDNVLSSDRDEWLAIDPKGVIAEPCYETAAMLRNPKGRVMKQSNPVKFLKRRIEILAEELNFDKERIQKWGIAQTVMAAVWSNDDQGKGWEEDMAIAEALDKIQF